MAQHFAMAFIQEIELRIKLIAASIRTLLSDVKLRPYEGLTDDLVGLFDASCTAMLNEIRPKLSEALKAAKFPGDGGTESDFKSSLPSIAWM